MASTGRGGAAAGAGNRAVAGQQHKDQRRGRSQRDGHQGAGQPVPADHGGQQQRAQGRARVAAHREDRHCGAAPPAARGRRHHRAGGVEQRGAQAAQGDQRQQRPEAAGQPGEPKEQAAPQHRRDHQPAGVEAPHQHPEQRLREGHAERGRQGHRAHLGEREPRFSHQNRVHDRQEVGHQFQAQVPARREQRDRCDPAGGRISGGDRRRCGALRARVRVGMVRMLARLPAAVQALSLVWREQGDVGDGGGQGATGPGQRRLRHPAFQTARSPPDYKKPFFWGSGVDTL